MGYSNQFGQKMFRNGEYIMSLFIVEFLFGLRVSDLLSLTWNQILSEEEFVIFEKKTDKRRVIRINAAFQDTLRIVSMLLESRMIKSSVS